MFRADWLLTFQTGERSLVVTDGPVVTRSGDLRLEKPIARHKPTREDLSFSNALSRSPLDTITPLRDESDTSLDIPPFMSTL